VCFENFSKIRKKWRLLRLRLTFLLWSTNLPKFFKNYKNLSILDLKTADSFSSPSSKWRYNIYFVSPVSCLSSIRLHGIPLNSIPFHSSTRTKVIFANSFVSPAQMFLHLQRTQCAWNCRGREGGRGDLFDQAASSFVIWSIAASTSLLWVALLQQRSQLQTQKQRRDS
jgi:hypothetical protein